MYSKFTSALLQKILTFLNDHPDLLNQKERKALDKLTLPEAFKNYLHEVSEAEFMKDVTLASKFAKGDKGLNLKGSKFFEAIVEFITSDFARKLDLLDSEYYLFSLENRHKIADKLVSGDSPLAESLRDIILTKTYQQISSATQKLLRQVGSFSFILVQSPSEISPEIKKDIRQKIREEDEKAFPVFQINKKLIGGIRIFKDGESDDLSWLSRVLHFTSLTSA